MSNDNKKIIITILLIVIGGLIIYSYLNNKQYKETEQTLIVEKETILENLTKIEEQYNSAIAQNTTLAEELELQKNSIINFRDSLKSLKNTNWKLIKFYKNKIKGLNKVSKKLLHLNDSIVKVNEVLNQENVVLQEDKQNLEQNLEQQTTYNDTLVKQNLNLAKKVAIGEIVKASNFAVTTFRERSSGKYKESSRARRVDIFKASLLLNENPIAKEKNIVVHIVIKNPDGSLLLQKGVFTQENGDRIKYAEESSIPYNKTAIAEDIVISTKGKKLEKGTYTINFYIDGNKVGTVVKVLK